MLKLAHVSHAYPDTPVLHDMSFELYHGRIGCLLGPSGCGKTTLLRCIAGFESLAIGRIEIDGVDVADRGLHMPAHKRGIGMVFQDYALLPHLTVRQNLEFGLGSFEADDKKRRIGEMLTLARLTTLADRYPHEISGGQQQRVALARALAPRPSLLLMDEPFSNLDAGLRQDLGAEMRDLLSELGTTALIVTHDHNDAFALADDVGVLNHGRLLQWDRAYAVYHRPADRFVATFVGKGVFVPGVVADANNVRTSFGFVTGAIAARVTPGTKVDLLLRPDDVIHDDTSDMRAVVVSRRFRGAEFLYELKLDNGLKLLSAIPSHHDHAIGERIGIVIAAEHVVVFAR